MSLGPVASGLQSREKRGSKDQREIGVRTNRDHGARRHEARLNAPLGRDKGQVAKYERNCGQSVPK